MATNTKQQRSPTKAILFIMSVHWKPEAALLWPAVDLDRRSPRIVGDLAKIEIESIDKVKDISDYSTQKEK